jgi:hypothetical protein
MHNSLIFRFAKHSDACHLAKLHLICGRNQTGSFMPILGLRFLTAYYKILLNAKPSVVVLAYCTKDKEYLGFHSGSIDAKAMRLSFSKAKYYLGWVALTSFWYKPKVLYEVIKRHLALNNKASDFIIKDGPRGEYWAWKPGGAPSYGAAKIHRLWHHIMFNLGCEYVRSEVNVEHSRVRKAVIAMGGKVLSETIDLNGNARIILEYDLEKYCNRFPL